MSVFRIILDLLFPPRDPERLVRDATTESLGMHAQPELTKDVTVALLPYRAALVRACITEAKFRGNEKAIILLANVLADYLQEVSIRHGSVTLVSIPLSPERLKERGYNQTERIVKHAVDRLPDMQVDTGLLVRTRDTMPQTSLSKRARLENVKGAFATTRPADPAYTYIVFDDVVTTGATLQAASEALRASGATCVIALALAH